MPVVLLMMSSMTHPARTRASGRVEDHAIHPADVRVLRALLAHHFLTPEQATRLLFAAGAKSHVYDKLRRLAVGGYVRALPMQPPRARGSSRLLYALDRAGLAHLRELSTEVPEAFRLHLPKKHSYLFYDHQLAVADVLVAALLLGRRSPRVALRRFVHDRELSHAPVAVALAGGEVVALVPDAFLAFEVTLTQTRGRFSILWEVDRGTVDLRAWRRRVRGYLTGLADGTLARAFGSPTLTIAVGVPDGRRRQELLALIGAVAEETGLVEEAGFFVVTDADPAATPPEVFFLAPIFAVPLTGELVPLLEHEELERPVFVAEKGGR
jgi:hypothetical protein